MSARHQAGAEPEARARVHRDPAGDVQPEAHVAPQGAEAAHLRVVPGRLAARPGPGGRCVPSLQFREHP